MDKVCQFYIILGNKNFTGKNDGNVYINATGAQDVKLINKAIFNAFHKKRDEGVLVASHIIFLIPNDEYKEQSLKIMDELNLDGKIEYLEEKKETIIPKIKEIPPQEVREEEKKEENIGRENTSLDLDFNKETIQKEVSLSTEDTLSKRKTTEEEIPLKYSPPKQDNIYHGEIDNSLMKKDNRREEMTDKDSATYMGYNPTLINNNVKNIVGMPRQDRKAAFITLPVIIFIISALLLVASIVILFVLD